MPTTQKRRFGILLEACSVAWGRLTDGGSICRNLKNRKKEYVAPLVDTFIPQTALRPTKSEEVISMNPPSHRNRLHGSGKLQQAATQRLAGRMALQTLAIQGQSRPKNLKLGPDPTELGTMRS